MVWWTLWLWRRTCTLRRRVGCSWPGLAAFVAASRAPSRSPTVAIQNTFCADFHRAMVATAPGEKLIIGRRPVRSWTRRTISSLFSCRKLHFVLRKINKKLLPPELLFLTPICTKSFVDLGFAPDPTEGAYSAPQTPQLYLGGLLLKGGQGRGERKYVLCPRKKKEKSELTQNT